MSNQMKTAFFKASKLSLLNYVHTTHLIIKHPITAAALQRRIVRDSAKSRKTRALSEHRVSNTHMELLHCEPPERRL